MPWPDHYTIKQNPFIVGLANYRDDLFKRFRITPQNAVPILFAAVIFPVSIMWGAKVEQDARVVKMKADFPNAPPTMHERWEARRKEQAMQKQQAEQGEGGAEGTAEDGQEGGGDEE